MKPSRIACVAGSLVLLSLVLVGCPSPPPGNGNGNGNSNSVANSNANASDGGGVPGTPVALEKRNATIASIDAALADLSPDDLDAAQSAIFDLLRGDSAIARVGKNDDGSVWARFTDGRPLVVALNHPIDEAVLNEVLAQPPESPRVAPPRPARFSPKDRQRSGGIATVSLPDGTDAFLFSTFDASVRADNHLTTLDGWLNEGGYTVVNRGRQSRGTIENLRLVRDAAVLYINGPGAVGYVEQADTGQPETPVYALATATLRAEDGSTDAQYAQELEDGEVGYIATPTRVLLVNQQVRFGRSSFRHYFVTYRFAESWWSFAVGAQVYIDADSSAAFEGFQQACFRRGAGSYIGWSSAIRTEDAIESAQYYFSRALGGIEGYGSAVVAKEVPNQRPFDLTTLIGTDMQQRRRTTPHAIPLQQPTTLAESFQLSNLIDGSPGRVAELSASISGSVSQSPLLRPSISRLEISDDPDNLLLGEPGTLAIGGSFGVENSAEIATVTVGGAMAEVRDAADGFILCLIPPDAAGAVEVVINGHKSNRRTLSVWMGNATVGSTDSTGVSRDLNLNVLLRGDVQNYRSMPGQPPTNWAPGFSGVCIPSRSSIVSHSVSGTTPCTIPNRSGNVFSQAAVATYPGFLPLGETGPGFYFRSGVFYNLESQRYTGTCVWGATIAAGERVQLNCVQTPQQMVTQTVNFEAPQGGVEVSVGGGNLNVAGSEVLELSGTVSSTVVSALNLTPQIPPSDDDPR